MRRNAAEPLAEGGNEKGWTRCAREKRRGAEPRQRAGWRGRFGRRYSGRENGDMTQPCAGDG